MINIKLLYYYRHSRLPKSCRSIASNYTTCYGKKVLLFTVYYGTIDGGQPTPLRPSTILLGITAVASSCTTTAVNHGAKVMNQNYHQ